MTSKNTAIATTVPAEEPHPMLILAHAGIQSGGLPTPGSQQEELPAYLQESRELAREQANRMSKFIRPPRLKVIQPMSQGEAADRFAVGDAVVLPHMIKLAGVGVEEGTGKPRKEGDRFHVVPLDFWVEYCKWTPIQLKGQMPAVVETTTDPNSRLAVMSRDVKLRKSEPVPGQDGYFFRAVEHINFLFVTLDVPDLLGMPFLVSFQRAEHKVGTTLMAMLQARRAASYGCVYAAAIKERTNEQGKWYGMDIMNPAPNVPRFVKHEPLFRHFEAMYGEIHQMIEQKLVQVDHDWAPEDESAPEADGRF